MKLQRVLGLKITLHGVMLRSYTESTSMEDLRPCVCTGHVCHGAVNVATTGHAKALKGKKRMESTVAEYLLHAKNYACYPRQYLMCDFTRYALAITTLILSTEPETEKSIKFLCLCYYGAQL